MILHRCCGTHCSNARPSAIYIANFQPEAHPSSRLKQCVSIGNKGSRNSTDSAYVVMILNFYSHKHCSFITRPPHTKMGVTGYESPPALSEMAFDDEASEEVDTDDDSDYIHRTLAYECTKPVVTLYPRMTRDAISSDGQTINFSILARYEYPEVQANIPDPSDVPLSFIVSKMQKQRNLAKRAVHHYQRAINAALAESIPAGVFSFVYDDQRYPTVTPLESRMRFLFDRAGAAAAESLETSYITHTFTRGIDGDVAFGPLVVSPESGQSDLNNSHGFNLADIMPTNTCIYDPEDGGSPAIAGLSWESWYPRENPRNIRAVVREHEAYYSAMLGTVAGLGDHLPRETYVLARNGVTGEENRILPFRLAGMQVGK